MARLKEKRNHKRVRQNKAVSLESLQIGVSENSRMLNCSENGMYFESNQLFQPGTEIFIRIEDLPDDRTETYECHHAKVIWGRRLHDSNYAYGYGVNYVKITNDQEAPVDDSDQITDMRKYPRIECDKPATFGFNNKFYNALISNISQNGCFIETEKSLRIRQILDLVVTGSKFSKNNKLKVEVVRLSPGGVGVKIRSIRRLNPSQPN